VKTIERAAESTGHVPRLDQRVQNTGYIEGAEEAEKNQDQRQSKEDLSPGSRLFTFDELRIPYDLLIRWGKTFVFDHPPAEAENIQTQDNDTEEDDDQDHFDHAQGRLRGLPPEESFGPREAPADDHGPQGDEHDIDEKEFLPIPLVCLDDRLLHLDNPQGKSICSEHRCIVYTCMG